MNFQVLSVMPKGAGSALSDIVFNRCHVHGWVRKLTCFCEELCLCVRRADAFLDLHLTLTLCRSLGPWARFFPNFKCPAQELAFSWEGTADLRPWWHFRAEIQ